VPKEDLACASSLPAVRQSAGHYYRKPICTENLARGPSRVQTSHQELKRPKTSDLQNLTDMPVRQISRALESSPPPHPCGAVHPRLGCPGCLATAPTLTSQGSRQVLGLFQPYIARHSPSSAGPVKTCPPPPSWQRDN
jgi:hypothetical protein